MDQLAKKTVSYFYDEEYANHSLGGCNPMRPHRVRLTNRLLEGYNMTKRMQVHRPRALDYDGLNYFHADGAVSFRVMPQRACHSAPCFSVLIGDMHPDQMSIFVACLFVAVWCCALELHVGGRQMEWDENRCTV
jgi:acetoin utilization deacetylase AcuC-like enzyme